jgi:hypothetical protein
MANLIASFQGWQGRSGDDQFFEHECGFDGIMSAGFGMAVAGGLGVHRGFRVDGRSFFLPLLTCLVTEKQHQSKEKIVPSSPNLISNLH